MPYDVFAQLRCDCPVYWNPESDGAGFWAVLRHTDIVAAPRDTEMPPCSAC